MTRSNYGHQTHRLCVTRLLSAIAKVRSDLHVRSKGPVCNQCRVPLMVAAMQHPSSSPVSSWQCPRPLVRFRKLMRRHGNAQRRWHQAIDQLPSLPSVAKHTCVQRSNTLSAKHPSSAATWQHHVLGQETSCRHSCRAPG